MGKRRVVGPFAYISPQMEEILAQRRPPTLKRSNSGSSNASSSHGQTEGKCCPYQDVRYVTLLEVKGSFLRRSSVGIDNESKALCSKLLASDQTIPQESLFRDDLLDITCDRIYFKNKARVFRDITPLLVPSAENLFIHGSAHLKILQESVNDCWDSSIPLSPPQPQPDYSVGFSREAFSPQQLTKLAPSVGDIMDYDRSFFLATYYIYFPFLACEVKCGSESLEAADRQNAHSMTLAVRAIVKLFRAVKRENELNRQILAFSISHDNHCVRIYGHYPVINGNDVKYYRYSIHSFPFRALEGKEKWTAYRFTKNVYDLWMSSHFKRICSAIDQLSDPFVKPPLPATGLSLGLVSHRPEPDADSVSMSEPSASQVAEQGQSSTKGDVTPGTPVTD